MKSILITICISLLIMALESNSQEYPFHLEKKRELNSKYQGDKVHYDLKIKQLSEILSIRANSSTKKLIASTTIRIINQGKAEVFVNNNIMYFDIALLDLLSHYSDEISLAEVKNDNLHIMEFNLSYAIALNDTKIVELISPYNTLSYTDEQTNYLWKNKLIAEEVVFDQILGFIMAHEFSHFALDHKSKIEQQFPKASDRNIKNPEWNKLRREIELEADSFATRLCLNALLQPAQLVTWLDLNEIRRRYYGVSEEYPTAAQRISVINKVYNEIVNNKTDISINLSQFKPLPPHRDLFKGDYYFYLEEFKKMRQYRQSLLMGIDQTIVALIKNNYPLEEVASGFIELVEQQKDLLAGAKKKEYIKQILELTSKPEEISSIDISTILEYIKLAEIGEYANKLLVALIKEPDADWKQIEEYLAILLNPAEQFLYGINYSYFLCNAAIRWYPEAFKVLQDKLPDNEIKAKILKPYQIGVPVRNPYPDFEERKQALATWDGNYK